ncbi:hypothetical protein MFRU_019g01340 [Monilinia fructicola]|nr:hypothetical protein MFRU_019g01340 [Monilinia fructicola]
MADDTRDPETSHPSTSSEVPSTKKYPKGIILGKDGKPCRSCNSFASFTSSTKSLQSRSSSTTAAQPPPDCPPDVAVLGRSTWTLLHTLTANYPTTPTPTDRTNMQTFMTLFSKLYPCWVCAEDFQAYMAENKVRTESRDEFGRWMCEAHNEVNRKLGKKEFDCGKWEERWRTGWKDGSCG